MATMTFSEKCFALLCNKNMKNEENSERNVISKDKQLQIQKREWVTFWSRIGGDTPEFSDKVVVDYGCGRGYDSLFMLQAGCKHIYALEISDRSLEKAKMLHSEHNFNNVTYIKNDKVGDLYKKIGAELVDIIVCRDVMEHVPSPKDVLSSMNSILTPGGSAYIGFTPLYKSPYGPHFKSKCKVPWVHLIFSEKTILNVFKRVYGMSESISSYMDIEGSGVNKLSYYEYIGLIDGFNWSKRAFHVNWYPDRPALTKILGIAVALSPTPRIKELFIVSSYISLKKDYVHGEA